MFSAQRHHENFCHTHACRSCGHGWRLFSQGLPLHAKLLAPLFFVIAGPGFFGLDWELIRGVCQAKTDSEVHEEIIWFSANSGNDLWVRRRLKVRLSAHRLQRSLGGRAIRSMAR